MFYVRGRASSLLLLALLGALCLQLVRVAHLYSANWDEAHHVYDGYLILTHREYGANAEVPPLVKMLAAAPLVRLHPALPAPTGLPQTEDAFRSGRAFVFGNGGDRLLFPARMACVGLSLLTAVLIFVAGRQMFGVLAGLCAVSLFVFDPNVLAHGALVSTDMGSACFLLAAALAPNAARTQLQLADVLAQQRKWSLARERYQLARRNLQQQRPDLEQEELGLRIKRGMAAAMAVSSR